MLRPFIVQLSVEAALKQAFVGVTTYRGTSPTSLPQFSISEAYISALSRAGATPVMIPLGLNSDALTMILERIDGLVFSGGGDIHPEEYRSQMHPRVEEIDRDRDQVELQLLERALAMRLPWLGICRGLQLINVGLGGELYEHILDQHPGAIEHQYYPGWPRDLLAHKVKIESDNRLGDIIQATEIHVNSLHHQGIKVLAPELHATAHAPDGLIEAIELPGYPFGMAVQWHPEWLPEQPHANHLLEAFVGACKAVKS